jgi:transcriptional regulator with XRE-family HTH domain
VRGSVTGQDKKYLKLQKTLANAFQTIREEAELTKLGMARKLGVSGMSIANWESGEGITLYAVHLYATRTGDKAGVGSFMAQHVGA